jgi:N-hydroxyarylamine O-acetyltransferase
VDINAYLDRIRYAGPVKPDVQTLHGLQHAHLQRIPFENLDIGLKRPIRLDNDGLWDKIIVQKRGGFCYELNGLFAGLLQEIGFVVTHLNARVFDQEGNLGIDFDHLALLVQIPDVPGRWLADVGFGDSFNEALNLDERREQIQALRAYRVEHTSAGYITWQRNYDSSWERHYFFDLHPHRFPEEYLPGCIYHQTSPRSSFTQWSIISRATQNGRVSLEDGWLILTENGQRTKQPIENKKHYDALLKQYFDITLTEEAYDS